MSDEDDRDAFLPGLQDNAEDVGRLFDAERSGGLIEDEHARAEMDGAGDRERLPLAARKTTDQPVAVVDPGDAEVSHGPDGGLVRGPPVKDLERSPADFRLRPDEERPPMLISGKVPPN